MDEGADKRTLPPASPSISGGTFTDLAAFDQRTGERWFAKSSTTPDDPTRGIAACLEKLGRPGESFELFVHGTTLVINACLEKDGAQTALITTEGFRDVLEIARGNRTESFNYLFKRRPFVSRNSASGEGTHSATRKAGAALDNLSVLKKAAWNAEGSPSASCILPQSAHSSAR
jgi:N-methylhydantoinase A/oxoprolinase/acetone carboxylase beta subunit